MPSWPPLTRQDAQPHLTSSLHTLSPFSTAWSPLHTPSQWNLCRLQPFVKETSARIEDHQFDQLFLAATPANRARLLSVASCHASSWLSVIPARGLNLHMDPAEFQVALKWWLGVDTSPHLRHHALTCRGGGDAVLCHNSLRDVVAQFCHRARLGGQLEVGGGTEADGSQSRPANYLVSNWSTGKPAAFDITVTSPLTLFLCPKRRSLGSDDRDAQTHLQRPQVQGLGVGLHSTGCRDLWVLGMRPMGAGDETYGCWG
ncbi:hypothetical protein EMCRGX_G006548 [Ephydatia muelleri]